MVLAISQRDGILDDLRIFYITENFYKIFEKFGILLIPVSSVSNLDVLVNLCDGLIIPGGADVGFSSKILDDSNFIDKLDTELIKLFHENGKPILGICRGLQVINVYFGGTLYKNIKNHKLPLDERHSISIYKDSFLYTCYGSSNILVNSRHHQAIKDVAFGFDVAAVSDDGVIEAIEGDNVYAVQWHPEAMNDIKFFEFMVNKVFGSL